MYSARLSKGCRPRLFFEEPFYTLSQNFMVVNYEDPFHYFVLTYRLFRRFGSVITHSIEARLYTLLTGDWNPQVDNRTSALKPGDINLATNQGSAFSHPQEAKSPLPRFLIVCNSSPIVINCQDEFAVLLPHLDIHPRGLRMTEDIG